MLVPALSRDRSKCGVWNGPGSSPGQVGDKRGSIAAAAGAGGRLAFRLLGGVAFLLARQNLLGDQAGIGPHRRLDAVGDIGIGLEESLGIFAAWPMRWLS